MNTEEFALELGHFGDRFSKQVEVNLRIIVLELFKHVVLQTPVDTGVARANWNLSFDFPSTHFDSALNKSNHAEMEKLVDAAQRVSQILKHRSVHITNHTAYIRRLEEGHSWQAPQGWVRQAVEEAQRKIES